MALGDSGLIRTGVASFTGSEYMTIGVDDFGDVADYGIDATRAVLDLLYPTPTEGRTVGLEQPLIQEHEPDTGIFCMKVASAIATYDGIVGGRILTITRNGDYLFGVEAGTDPEGVFEACPYPRAVDETYRICAGFARYPIELVPAGGAVRVKRWRDAIGFATSPDSVVAGGGGLVLTLTDNGFWGQSTGGGAWPAHGTIGRRVCVWKTNPVTFGAEAVFFGTALSDGTDVTVEIDHTFGQSSPSLEAGDYSVVILGLSICPTAAFGDVQGFWTLSTVENGDVTPGLGPNLFAYRPEDLLTEIGETNDALDALDDRLAVEELETELRGFSRCGIELGDEANYRTWAPVVTNESTAILLTFPAWGDGQWVRAGGHTAREWGPSLGAGVVGNAGRTFRFPKATGTGTKFIYLYAGPDGDDNYAIVSNVAPLQGEGFLAFAYDYTSGATTITARPVDLYPLRGAPPVQGSGVGNVDDGTEHSFGHVVFYDPARTGDYASSGRGSRSMMRSDESPAPTTYRKQHTILSHHRQDATDTDPAATGAYVLDALTDWDNEQRIFRFFGPGGTSQVGGAERVYAELGASIAIEAREASSGGGGRAALAIVESVANPEQLFDLDDEGGNTSEATSGGQRWSLEIGEGVDLRLRGNGKVVVRTIPLWPNGFSTGGVWTWSDTGGVWTDGGAAGVLYIPIPPPSTDQRTGTTVEGKICRVVLYGNNAGGASANDLTAEIVRHTPVAFGLAGAVNISSVETWTQGQFGERTIEIDGATVDGIPAGIAPIPSATYYLKIEGAKDLVTPTTSSIYYAAVYYRVFTLGA